MIQPPQDPALDFSGRVERLRSLLPGTEVDGCLITSLTNIQWLTGFTGSNGWVVVTGDDMQLITDGRYGDQARQQMDAAGVEATVGIGTTRAMMTALLDGYVAEHRINDLGFEAQHLSVADHLSLSGYIGVRWRPKSGLVEGLRRHKEPGEVTLMEHAADIADAALAAALPLLSSEPTEAQFRDALEAEMRSFGADGPSFETIVAAGSNAALPHHRPDSTRIVEGMSVVIDFGALYAGYHSDMTRTFTIGEPSAMQAEVYHVVLEAQRARVAAVAEGARGRHIDNVCRGIISDAGWGEFFTHGTGHGVGLQIHESPWLTQGYDDTLAAMDVVTVEPGVYRGDFGGVRIEDMVVVTTNGCRPLTKTPKDAPCLQLPPTT